MKLTKILLGGALAAGLMAFAPDQAQAAVGSTLYAPLNIKGTVTYQSTANGAFKMMSYSSKTLLKDLGYSRNASLALGPNFHVFIINPKTKAMIADLTTNGTVIASTTWLISSGGTHSHAEQGTITLTFDTSSAHATGQPIIDLMAQGIYTYSTMSTTKHYSEKFSGKSLTGTVTVSGVTYSTSPTTVSGSGSGGIKTVL